MKPFRIAVDLVSREVLLHLLDVRVRNGAAFCKLMRPLFTGIGEAFPRPPIGDPLDGALRGPDNMLRRFMS